VARGLSNKEIGEVLGISEATVKWHLNIIFSRLNVSDRTQATVVALQRGIVQLQ
jgi:DNA-binding NarL/FixJ family response regulator